MKIIAKRTKNGRTHRTKKPKKRNSKILSKRIKTRKKIQERLARKLILP